MKLRVTAWTALTGILTMAACTGTPTPTPRATSTTGAATVTATATVPPGTPVFQDDFSRTDLGWQTLESPEATFAYRDGGFRVLIKKERIHGLAIAPGPSVNSGEFTVPFDQFVAADVQRVSGPADKGFYGVACRAVSNKDHYYFSISSDGFFGIDKNREGKETLPLANVKGDERSPAIRKGLDTVNHIRAECVGGRGTEPTRLTLYVNGEKVAEVTDEDELLNETAGNVGLGADAGDKPPTDVLFDNFVLGATPV